MLQTKEPFISSVAPRLPSNTFPPTWNTFNIYIASQETPKCIPAWSSFGMIRMSTQRRHQPVIIPCRPCAEEATGLAFVTGPLRKFDQDVSMADWVVKARYIAGGGGPLMGTELVVRRAPLELEENFMVELATTRFSLDGIPEFTELVVRT